MFGKKLVSFELISYLTHQSIHHTSNEIKITNNNKFSKIIINFIFIFIILKILFQKFSLSFLITFLSFYHLFSPLIFFLWIDSAGYCNSYSFLCQLNIIKSCILFMKLSNLNISYCSISRKKLYQALYVTY